MPRLPKLNISTCRGVRISADRLTPGIYIRRTGSTTEKIIVQQNAARGSNAPIRPVKTAKIRSGNKTLANSKRIS